MASRRGLDWRGEEGSALVEAALILPVMLVIVFALVDLSLYFWQRSLATKAAELGVRLAVVSDSVAEGPGLTPSESASWWFGLPPGRSCADGDCPSFSVSCTVTSGCQCAQARCAFSLSAAKLEPILAAMRAVVPRLSPENLRIRYATNGLGYVSRPPPVPVDVTVEVVGLTFEPLFAGALLPRAVPLTAAAALPSEDLVTGQ